jgi:hypothetical protein
MNNDTECQCENTEWPVCEYNRRGVDSVRVRVCKRDPVQDSVQTLALISNLGSWRLQLKGEREAPVRSESLGHARFLCIDVK